MATVFENLAITTDFSMRLCALLRLNGVDVGMQQSIACMQAILLMETVDEDMLRGIYRTTLINRKQDLWQLHCLYDLLLKDYLSPRIADDDDTNTKDLHPVVVERRRYSEGNATSANGDDAALIEGYSIREVDHYKDFRLIPKGEISSALAELKKVAKKHASIARRKTRRAKRCGHIDLRGSVRDSVKFDGEIVNWRFKRKKPTHSRFVIVSDVSGSMEIYSIFLLNFLHVLNFNSRMKMESFVFSTRLERLTKEFRSKSFEEMLKNVALHFSAWSGGTKIGSAIETLNNTFGALITPKTSVIIMSDGWDTGEITLLDREMAKLRSRAKRIVWINPLKAAPGYEPLALGMATARPYCDQFITGHSIDSLEKFAHLVGM